MQSSAVRGLGPPLLPTGPRPSRLQRHRLHDKVLVPGHACRFGPLRGWRNARSSQASPRPTAATAAEIIADVLKEENKRSNPASLLELLDRQGWGVQTKISRRFATKFASVTLAGSWEDDTSGTGRVESRRMALLAVFQEWLVARSLLVGRVLDTVERLRPGYLQPELVQRVRAARAAGSYLTPDSEVLDGPCLSHLAALVLPPEVLVRQLDVALAATRAEVLALPGYYGRPDLVLALDRGLALLRASVVRTAETDRFRAAHIREAVLLQAELRKRQQAKQETRETVSGHLGMWVRSPPAPPPRGPDTTARSANDRLYSGQLVPIAPRWMAEPDRRVAAAAPPGRTGPRGLPYGRSGLATFRPAPGATLYGNPGSPGAASFGGADRAAFNDLDGAILEIVARARDQVPAAAMSAFARQHRTALLDALSEWQWQQLVASGEAGRGFYQEHAAHASSVRPAGPLLVGRRTRIVVSPGPELESLRALARRKGPEVLDIVHPLARKQAVSHGEWEYWRNAYRLWDRFTHMPPVARSASLGLLLGPEQLPVVLADAAAAGGDGGGGGGPAAAAAATAAAAKMATEDLDISSLTSMSSMDFDDALPAGVTLATLSAAAAPATPFTDGVNTPFTPPTTNPFSSPSPSSSTSSPPGSSSSTSSTSSSNGLGPTETSVTVAIPPPELRSFLLALLELLPSHVGEAAAALSSGGSSTTNTSGGGGRGGAGRSSSPPSSSAAAAGVGEWLPARATALQIRYSPPSPSHTAASHAALAPLAPIVPNPSPSSSSTASSSAGASASSSAAAPPPLPEELEPSYYEVRWAQEALTLNSGPVGTTLIALPAAATAATSTPSLVSTSGRAAGAADGGSGGGNMGRWCAPVRLSSAQLMSLVNIFTDVAQQVPDLYGLTPPRLVVPTLSPLERLTSAAQGAAASVLRVVGLLALLAVPLAAAVKAGGGDLNAMMATAAATATAATSRTAVPPSTHGSRHISGGGVSVVMVPRSTPSASAEDAAAPSGASRDTSAGVSTSASPSSSPSSLSSAAAADADSATLAALCRQLEVQLEGRLWLEVTGTAAASSTATAAASSTATAATNTAAAVAAKAAPGGVAQGEAAPPPQPEFQVVVERRTGTVLGCRPVNAAGMALYPEMPLAAALRGRAAAAALEAHLAGLSRERIERGKATPGRFQAPYRPAVYVQPPLSTQQRGQQQPQEQQEQEEQQQQQQQEQQEQQEASGTTGVASTSGRSAVEASQAGPGGGGGADGNFGGNVGGGGGGGMVGGDGVAVLKVELWPSGAPTRRAAQSKGKRMREFAQAEVVVRPWYDSDSLLRWMEAGVQLPSLGQEIRGGLLVEEESQRAAFLAEYERLAMSTTRTAAAATDASTAAVGRFGTAAAAAAAEGRGGTQAPQAQLPPQQQQQPPSLGAGTVGDGSSGGDGPVLQPQQLSEQQLQEALQQLFTSLGVPGGTVHISGKGG